MCLRFNLRRRGWMWVIEALKRSQCASWFTPGVDSTLNHFPGKEFRQARRKSPYTKFSLYYYFFLYTDAFWYSTLKKFTLCSSTESFTSQIPNSYYHEGRTAVGVPHVQRSASVWPEWAGCVQGCEVNLFECRSESWCLCHSLTSIKVKRQFTVYKQLL